MVGLAKPTILVGALFLSIAYLSQAVTDPYATGFVASLVHSGMAILAG